MRVKHKEEEFGELLVDKVDKFLEDIHLDQDDVVSIIDDDVPANLVSLDIEFAALTSDGKQQMVSMCIVRHDKDTNTFEILYQKYWLSTCEISPSAFIYHKLSRKKLTDHGAKAFGKSDANKISKVLRNSIVIVFGDRDRQFIFDQFGLVDKDADKLRIPEFIDVQNVYHDRYPPGDHRASLLYAGDFFEVTPKKYKAHVAYDDACLNWLVYEKLK